MSETKRTAVITGATSDRGIGKAVGSGMHGKAGRSSILDLDGEKSAKVAAEIGNQFAIPASGYAIDVTSEESVAAAQHAVAAEVTGPCLRSARLQTSQASPLLSRSSRPRWTCGTRSWPSTPPAPTWSPRRFCRT